MICRQWMHSGYATQMSMLTQYHLCPFSLTIYHNRVLIALHRIKGDTETLIHNFNRPVKTFIEANLDQSRLISRLSALLPSLQPLLAMTEGDYHAPWPVPGQGETRLVKEENWSETKGLGSRHEFETPDEERLEKRRVKREYSTVGRNESACFDRGPRSRSIIPSTNVVVDRELRWAAPMSL